MMGLQGGINFKVFEQFATGTGILGQNQIDFLEQLHGPEGHIPKIPDRGRNQIKFSHASKVNPSHGKRQKRNQENRLSIKAINRASYSSFRSQLLYSGLTILLIKAMERSWLSMVPNWDNTRLYSSTLPSNKCFTKANVSFRPTRRAFPNLSFTDLGPAPLVGAAAPFSSFRYSGLATNSVKSCSRAISVGISETMSLMVSIPGVMM